jgi:hypothetical protein
MCIFAKYKNIFGEPRKGVHSYRLFDFAIIDILLTIIPVCIVGLYYNYDFKKITILILILFFIGEILHLLFCVNTKFIEILN